MQQAPGRAAVRGGPLHDGAHRHVREAQALKRREASAQALRGAQAQASKRASHKPQAPGPWTLDKVSRPADRGAGL
jgi:hypothetical protein